jgi:hypothetical protein
MDMSTAVLLYKVTGKFWPFKTAILKYVAHCYLDTANPSLFQGDLAQ